MLAGSDIGYPEGTSNIGFPAEILIVFAEGFPRTGIPVKILEPASCPVRLFIKLNKGTIIPFIDL